MGPFGERMNTVTRKSMLFTNYKKSKIEVCFINITRILQLTHEQETRPVSINLLLVNIKTFNYDSIHEFKHIIETA